MNRPRERLARVRLLEHRHRRERPDLLMAHVRESRGEQHAEPGSHLEKLPCELGPRDPWHPDIRQEQRDRSFGRRRECQGLRATVRDEDIVAKTLQELRGDPADVGVVVNDQDGLTRAFWNVDDVRLFVDAPTPR